MNILGWFMSFLLLWAFILYLFDPAAFGDNAARVVLSYEARMGRDVVVPRGVQNRLAECEALMWWKGLKK